MNRYFLKVDPINECVGGFGQSRMISRWEGGEVTFKSKGPRYPAKGSKDFAPQIQVGDELWIWSHEEKNGQGLVARASAANIETSGEWLRITITNVALVSSPFGFSKFKERPDNGHNTGTRILDYKSINRWTGAYLIDEEDYLALADIVSKHGRGLLLESISSAATAPHPSKFSWANEIKLHSDEMRSALIDRRLSWRKTRPIQQHFRNSLLGKYQGQCVLTGCNVEEALEAAHILPHNGDPQRDRPDNGILLRRDLHTMFDAMLWSIDPSSNKVQLARQLDGTSYGRLNGKLIVHYIDFDAMQFHFAEFKNAGKKV